MKESRQSEKVMGKEVRRVQFSEVRRRFSDYNKEHNILYGDKTSVPEITAVIVYKPSNFIKPYTERERSYRVSNLGGKAFFRGMYGRSIFGDCLDGKDLGARLDAYDWDIDYCYFE